MIFASRHILLLNLRVNNTPRRVSGLSLRNIITMARADKSLGFEQPRLVAKTLLAKSQSAGVGAVVRRSIGGPELKSLDPFLLLDEFAVSPPAGFPDHPHRGFETVTYLLQGGLTHQDSSGNKGTVHAGEVQWITAGKGIVHSEMPVDEGTNEGLQLWINLSSKDKMMEPRYQEMPSDDIPKAEQDGVGVKVIAGEAMGVDSPVYTRTPTLFLDFTLRPNSQYHQKIPECWNTFVYILQGEGIFGVRNTQPASAHHILVLGPGEGLSMWNVSPEPLRFILVGGQPINEPVFRQGPFVMSTQAEVDMTIEDYDYGRNGFEMAKNWKSN